jgi:hypothetical protein
VKQKKTFFRTSKKEEKKKDVCNDSDEPFNCLKVALLGLFRKRKWQSYFELLRLSMEMQGLKPSVLMGKLKQHLPLGVP